MTNNFIQDFSNNSEFVKILITTALIAGAAIYVYFHLNRPVAMAGEVASQNDPHLAASQDDTPVAVPQDSAPVEVETISYNPIGAELGLNDASLYLN
jgi:hypothetical protein